MEAVQIESALFAAKRAGRVLRVVFGAIAAVCAFNAVVYFYAAFESSCSGRVGGWYLFIPGILEWVVFLVASLVCASIAHKVACGSPLFVHAVFRRLFLSAIALWAYAFIDSVWFLFLQRIGTLINNDEITIAITENGFSAGFYFDIGAVFAAAALTLVASLVWYGATLQAQADELF